MASLAGEELKLPRCCADSRGTAVILQISALAVVDARLNTHAPQGMELGLRAMVSAGPESVMTRHSCRFVEFRPSRDAAGELLNATEFEAYLAGVHAEGAPPCSTPSLDLTPPCVCAALERPEKILCVVLIK